MYDKQKAWEFFNRLKKHLTENSEKGAFVVGNVEKGKSAENIFVKGPFAKSIENFLKSENIGVGKFRYEGMGGKNNAMQQRDNFFGEKPAPDFEITDLPWGSMVGEAKYTEKVAELRNAIGQAIFYQKNEKKAYDCSLIVFFNREGAKGRPVVESIKEKERTNEENFMRLLWDRDDVYLIVI